MSTSNLAFPPSAMTRERFSRKQTLDVQTAMATALRDLLADGEWQGPDGMGTIKFAQVYAEWPTTNDQALSPAACVLPSGEFRYAPSHPVPRLLEDTWEPRGALGLGLYELSEVEVDFEVEVRAASKPERSAVVAGIESALVSPGVLNGAQAARYGVLRPMPGYWGLEVRLSLQAKRLEDSAEAATRNRWEAVFVVRAQAKNVRLDVVSPFTVRIFEVFE